jgi:catechol 2,3-dioxygenase-like lactoylglutathione lyase family enzyme
MPNFIQITLFMHVPDLEAALAFFRDILGFEATWREADGVYPELAEGPTWSGRGARCGCCKTMVIAAGRRGTGASLIMPALNSIQGRRAHSLS